MGSSGGQSQGVAEQLQVRGGQGEDVTVQRIAPETAAEHQVLPSAHM